MVQDTLYRRISQGKQLTPEEIDALMEIFGKGCQEKTKRRLRSCLTYHACVQNVGIFERVLLGDDACGGSIASYCAGQSYPDEIRTVRDCILGR